MTDEFRIRIAARLYEIRQAARDRHGADYESVVSPWRDALRKIAAARGCDVIDVLLSMIGAKPPSGAVAMVLIAAAVDVMEAET